ncbi:UDP-N-acetylmuramoyl-tripeptide--D-alanyl-D-alanine ligase [Oceanobacillus halotolerans]|uniref:UDP-N-acetylmuramoyl-tripeptide--D-alanyl-D- alanine ligase n=1 Tax=Oceanobacillus halotolerans TaxID=2663380 RepID=UPI00299EA389|nr:UDP-N-acetylmuramoyl-tripeptide--D-alanyl-D-alanine ligase [Oceanobacillus halotolerans]
MMLFTTKWLSTIFPTYNGSVMDENVIEHVTTDSRVKSSNSLFIPLVGEKFDGHDYVKQAINQGAVATLWNKQKEVPANLPSDFILFYVDDTLDGLQQLAKIYRNEVNPIVIGITGSNGKTTTKDIVSTVVGMSFKTHHTKGNLNNLIGLPLTMLAMPRDTEMLVLEMGMNQFGEIEQLSTMAKPDYAIITNIGESHIEYLGSRDGIAKAKLEIIAGMKEDGTLLIDGDEPLLTHKDLPKNVIRCGFDAHNDIIIKHSVLTQDTTVFTLSDGNEYTVPLLGKHHALNATFAITLAKELKIETSLVQKALSSTSLTGMRFERLSGKNGSSIVNDAYNASPTSMKASIEVVKQLKGYTQKVLVLGDMLELGENAKELHYAISDIIDEQISTVLTYGDDAKEISKAVKDKGLTIECKHVETKKDLLQAIQPYLKRDVLILFKASRRMEFETIVDQITHS